MYKNQLQELSQRSCFNLPSYTCIREGPDHAPRFKATVNFNGETYECPNYCSTLRQAEHSAAEVALNALANRGPSNSLAARILDETGVYKNLLQEVSQRVGSSLPTYTTFRSGLGHLPVFTCTVELAGCVFTGEPAKNKKQAEKNAAMSAWSSLKHMARQSENLSLQKGNALFIPNFVGMMEQLGSIIRTSSNGTSVVGTGPDGNYGLAQCYGDLSAQDCILCYAEARTVLPSCFPNNGGRIYLDGCFMRVQNYSFFQEVTGPDDTFVCKNTTTKDVSFQDTVKQAVLNAVTDASRSIRNFAREQLLVANRKESVYVLAECWRTLSPSSCRACLENATMLISKCLPWSEGRVLNAGCFMRYSDTNFLNPVPTTNNSYDTGKIIAIVVSVVSSVALITVASMIGVYAWKHRYVQKKRKGSYDAKKLSKMLIDSSLNFKYSTVEKATGKWDELNKLGQGGFGTVYKGVLSDGREIAVKRLFFNNKFRAADFYNEVNMISSVQHKNLVRLLGCSCSGPESILIYEYLPNMSLDHFIFDVTKGRTLNWEKRHNIITGTAEGLVYLHENTKCRIIHRDIKAANILLDLRLRAKIADFGLARSFQDDKSHISTAIAGTLGYMAPEYIAHGQLTEKVDVYSFGVLVLEVVTGIENNKSKNTEYTDSLVAIAWNHFQQNKAEEIFDPNLMMHLSPNQKHQKEAIKAIQVGLLCTQEDPSLRPSMSTVLKMLAEDDEPLPAPSNPPFIDENAMELNEITHKLHQYFNNDNSCSIATVDHSQFLPR